MKKMKNKEMEKRMEKQIESVSNRNGKIAVLINTTVNKKKSNQISKSER